MDSPFEILGIEPDADDADIERAYRRRVKEAHPDTGGSTREFQLVRAAYEEVQTGYERERTNGGDERPAEEPTDQPEPEGHRVEYLNYEVLDDHGWELTDDDLFEKASAEGLDPADYGLFLAHPRETLLEAAENRGFAWPYACRGGACANCAVAVVEGELEMPTNHILSATMIEHGIRLSCIGEPITDDMKVVYNVKDLPGLDELRLPSYRFEQARLND